MTKKHFIMLSGTIRDSLGATTEQGRDALRCFALRLCAKLKRENPLFDQNRFLAACGVNTSEN